MISRNAYHAVAREYEVTQGEPLVAGPEWVTPIYEMCLAGVECDPAFDLDQTRTDAEAEAVSRTVEVIAVVTHGVVRDGS